MFTPIDTSFAFWPWFAMFLVIVCGIFACLGDSITTMIGLTAGKGFIEANPLASWLFKKVGEDLACFISSAAVLFISLGIGAHWYWPGMFFAGVVAAGETFFTVKNYLLMKKLGISLQNSNKP